MCDRIVVLIDMDCFYCQVETRLNPSLTGKPLAVVQYNQWQGGGIIAVNYEARAFGVTRHLRGKEAKAKCPDIVLVSVPSVRGKADISKYRDAGREVAAVFCQFTDCVERASVDEAYLDITKTVEERIRLNRRENVTPKQLPNTFVVGFSELDSNDEDQRANGLSTWLTSFNEVELNDPSEEKLAVGGILVEEMRAAVFAQTGFRCSAGIAHNKILAKLACGLHKPNRQTILPQSSLAVLYKTLPIKKVRSLGGKFGDYVTKILGCDSMGELAKFSLSHLQERFDEKQGSWLYNIARGIDLDQVTPRLVSKTIGCCKNFPGKQSLCVKTDVKKWIAVLSSEVMERLEKDYQQNRRRAKMITVSYKQKSNPNSGSSRCGLLSSYDVDNMAKEAYELLKSSNSAPTTDDKWDPPLTHLGISAGKFSSEDTTQNKTINSFFKSSEKLQQTETKGKQMSTETVVMDKLVESETSTSSRDIGANNCPRAPDSSVQDNESFFRAYFKKKNGDKLVVTNESHCAAGANSEKCLESMAVLSSTTVLLNDKQELVCTEGESNPKAVDPPAPTTLPDNIISNENEYWISPHEIFPNFDEADEETVALLPSPMQRKIKNIVEMKHKICNTAMKSNIKSSRVNHCEDSSLIIGAKDYTDQCVFHEAESPRKVEEETKDVVSYETLDNNYTKNYRTLIQKKHSSGSGKLTLSLACPETSYSNIAPMELKHESGNNVAISTVNITSDTSSKSSVGLVPHIDEHNNNETSGNIVSEECPHCKTVVLLTDYPEHLDFHVAEQLHKELNRGDNQASTSVANKIVKSKINVGKRKKGGNNKNNQDTKTENKRVRSITAFFTPLK